MNPHFAARPTGHRDIPSTVYAKIDSVEMVEDGRVLVQFDAVSASSAQDLISRRSTTEWDRIWSGMRAGGPDTSDVLAEFNALELVHLEVLVPQSMVPTAVVDGESSSWFLIALDPSTGGIPATAYTGLFEEGQATTITAIEPPHPATDDQLDAALSMKAWPLANPRRLAAILRSVQAKKWLVFDVGQGSANGFVKEGPVTLFHDIGCGVYSNTHTCPSNVVLCYSRPAPIVLSHWDKDHWAGASRFAPSNDPTAFLDRTWIVPCDLTVGPSHIAFAANILLAGGTLAVLPQGAWTMPWIKCADGRRLRLLRGKGLSRNGSGIALEIKETSQRGWLATGDVDYKFLHPRLAKSYVAIAVPHHGSGVITSTPPPAPAPGYSRLVYSFGSQNTYDHPRANCVMAHDAVGWTHANWAGANLAWVACSGDVRATACHSPGMSHLGSIAIGWTQAPTLSAGLPCCGNCNVLAQQA